MTFARRLRMREISQLLEIVWITEEYNTPMHNGAAVAKLLVWIHGG